MRRGAARSCFQKTRAQPVLGVWTREPAQTEGVVARERGTCVTFAALLIIGAAAVSFGAGILFGERLARGRLREADSRYQTLKRDYDAVTTLNLRLMSKETQRSEPQSEDALARFFELYDTAKRVLHRALDQHNASAPRPIVISRDGANLLRALDDLPAGRIEADDREEAGVRSWLRRVFELERTRRVSGDAPDSDAILTLEAERVVWRRLNVDGQN